MNSKIDRDAFTAEALRYSMLIYYKFIIKSSLRTELTSSLVRQLFFRYIRREIQDNQETLEEFPL